MACLLVHPKLSSDTWRKGNVRSFILLDFLFFCWIILLFRNMKEKLSRPRFPLAKNILSPSKESIHLDTRNADAISFSSSNSGERPADLLWKMASWEYGKFPFCSSLSLEISLLFIESKSSASYLLGFKNPTSPSSLWLSLFHQLLIIRFDGQIYPPKPRIRHLPVLRIVIVLQAIL